MIIEKKEEIELNDNVLNMFPQQQERKEMLEIETEAHIENNERKLLEIKSEYEELTDNISEMTKKELLKFQKSNKHRNM